MAQGFASFEVPCSSVVLTHSFITENLCVFEQCGRCPDQGWLGLWKTSEPGIVLGEKPGLRDLPVDTGHP